MKEFWCDTETGGTVPSKNPLLQIAGLIIIDGDIKEEVDINLQPFPEDMINDRALEINGIHRDELLSPDRMTPAAGYQKLMNTLKKYVDKYTPSDKFQFCAYNARFDADFIRQFMLKNSDSYFGSWFWFPPIDIMQWFALLTFEGRPLMKKFTLKDCCEEADLGWDDAKAHEAMYDIQKTRELAQFCMSRFKKGVTL